MINSIYQLINPHFFSIAYSNIDFNKNVIVRPTYMSICQADQRYYRGTRDAEVLQKKLPMALIHEACGEVVYDSSNTFKVGQNVIMIPNIPGNSPEHIYENYSKSAKFMSSNVDGFMREFVNLPASQLVQFNNIKPNIAAICELISVGTHAAFRFNKAAHEKREIIGIWGDGSVSYILSCILKEMFPNSKIIVIGKDIRKLSCFSFVYKTYLGSNLPENFTVDHAFECAGGEGSYFAIDDIIKYIEPQGTVMLLGVSENKVAINTRNVLEKGLSFIGCSRSGRADFENAINLLQKKDFQNRLCTIVNEEAPVCNIDDIHRVFKKDSENLFKTVFRWSV
ncbi:MAG: ribitol-5-phosphate 2-dehydrogenase [Eubacteriales bacterium SKADARSKE-1]|nr:ribitol-5-phosphate 2-dehydrogenase [Eubacteriales bacterium SKADARSKE-1]